MKWKCGKFKISMNLEAYYIYWKINPHVTYHPKMKEVQGPLFLDFWVPKNPLALYLPTSQIFSEYYNFQLCPMLQLSPIPYLRVILSMCLDHAWYVWRRQAHTFRMLHNIRKCIICHLTYWAFPFNMIPYGRTIYAKHFPVFCKINNHYFIRVLSFAMNVVNRIWCA